MKMHEDVVKAAEVLKSGGIILYPTDTVWGIGCDATNEMAVKRIYQIKKRDDSKSMLILLDTADKIPFYVKVVPDIAYQLIAVTDSPLTIIYPGAQRLATSLPAEDGSIGIRITSDLFCKEVIKRTGFPLVSSSANISGQLSPSLFSEVSDEIKENADYIVHWRQDDYVKRKPSPIIKLEGGNVFRILRK